MEKKPLTPEEALAANGNRPIEQTFTARHPDTGEKLIDVKPWQDAKGNWLPTEWDEAEGKFKVKVKTESEG